MVKNNSILKSILKNGPLFIVIAAILWSFDGVFRTDLRTSGISPINIVFWEHLLGLVLLIPVVWYTRKEFLKLDWIDWLIFAGIGLFAGVLGTLFYTAALGQVGFVSFSVVVLLQKLQPIWAIASSRLILKEKLPANFIFWAGLALFASYLISFKDLTVQFTFQNKTTLAIIFGVLASMFWGLATTFGKRQLHKISFGAVTSLRFAFGALFSFIGIYLLSWYSSGLGNYLAFPLGSEKIDFSLTQSQLSNLLLVVVFTGLGAMLLYYFGLQKTQAKVATLCELAWPASALVIDIFYNIYTKQFGFFPEVFSWTQILGIVILLVSIWQVSKTQKEIVVGGLA